MLRCGPPREPQFSMRRAASGNRHEPQYLGHDAVPSVFNLRIVLLSSRTYRQRLLRRNG